MNVQGKIVGTGSSVPKRVLTNRDLERIVDTSDAWIVRRTGIRERRISIAEEGETTTRLAMEAGWNALEMAGVSPGDLDMIVVGTVTPDRQFPSTACMIQNELKCGHVPAFDVSAGCSGFLYALTMANNTIRCGGCTTALVVGVERLSGVVNWEDRNTCVLLGDGAGAVVLRACSDGAGVLSTHLKADGSLWELLYSAYGNRSIPALLEGIEAKPYHLKMQGRPLFKKAVASLASIAQEALEENGLTSRDIALVVPHQANLRIIQALADNLGIPMEKVYTNVDRYGNTSSASIPIALDEAHRNGLIQEGDCVLLVSFGAGLTWGACLVRWAI